jgi:hypothetical protein
MKLTVKYSLLFIGLVFFTQLTQAQGDRKVALGIKIIPGVDWTKGKTNNVLNGGMGIGFSFGLMADIKLGDNYFFTPELLVTSMNNRIKLKDTANHNDVGTGRSYNNISYKYSLRYIEIPFTFKFKTNENDGMRYWVQVGVSPGVLIGNSATISASPSNGNTTQFPLGEKYDPNSKTNDKYDFQRYEDNVNRLRASMILGAGIEYRLSGNTRFYGGIRYNNGFTDLLNDKQSKMINNIIGLEIGLFF